MREIPLVLIGGWGAPVTSVIPLAADWPGPVVTYSLDDRQIAAGSTPADLVQRWLEAVGEPAVWAGWSLGGQLAMQAAVMAPKQVAGVFTCCSTPCFLERDDWQVGMPEAEFEVFRVGLARQTHRFWKRFLLLQVRGDGQEGAGRAAWKPWLEGGVPFSLQTLLAGLEWLRSLDQRAAWNTLQLPRQHLFGENDLLVNPNVPKALAGIADHSHTVPGMAHLPFGDYAEILARQLALFGADIRRGGV